MAGQCINCSLCKVGNKSICVMGEGPKAAKIMLVGEALGVDEDILGRPFVGKAGRVLNSMLEKAGLEREEIYVTNICKCRPVAPQGSGKENRAPKKEEIAACTPYLEDEIKQIKPKVIVPLGGVALKYFLKDRSATVTTQRGTVIDSEYYGTKILGTFHPAAILRHVEWEGTTILDLQKAKALVEGNLAEKGSTKTNIVDTLEATEKLFELLKVNDFAFDIETTDLDFRKDKVISIGFAINENEGWFLPLLKPDGSDHWDLSIKSLILKGLKEVFVSPVKKVLQNGKYDIKFLKMLGFEVNNFYFDTLLAHALIDENAQGMHGLKQLAVNYTTFGNYEQELKDYQRANKLGHKCLGVPTEILARYNVYDAVVTYILWKKFEPMLEAEGLTKLFRKIVMPLSNVLMETEMLGAPVDKDYLLKTKAEFEERLETLLQSIHKLAGYQLNLKSTKQLRELLFNKLKLKTTFRTPKGMGATNEEALEEMAPQHPIPKLMLSFRETQKMHSTYLKGILELLDENNRVHTNYLIHGTHTGRLSSRDPNLQNIPRDKVIRNLFTVPDGKVMVQGDLSAAEIRGWAHYSGDEKLIADLEAGVDIHRVTASTFYGIPFEKVVSEQRTAAKMIAFGVIYGRGARSVAEECKMTVDDAKKLIRQFFDRYPKAEQWIYDIREEAKQKGFVKNFFGRFRRLPGVNALDTGIQAEAFRQAVNAPIQSLISDITTFASVRLYEPMKELGAYLILNVHDSLVYEALEENKDKVVDLLSRAMSQKFEGLKLAFPVEIKVGKRWGDLKAV